MLHTNNNFNYLNDQVSFEDLLFQRMIIWLKEGKNLNNYNDIRLFNMHHRSNYSEFNIYTRLSKAINASKKNLNKIVDSL